MTRPNASAAHPAPALPARQLVAAPRDYFLGPVFAATPQSGPREVTIGQRRYLIGGFHPLRRELSPPALDVRHARAIFCLLSFRDPHSPSRLVRFSFNEFCHRYANSNGGRYARAIAEIVADLLDSYIRVTDINTRITHEYRLIEQIDIEKRPIRRKDASGVSTSQLEMWLNGCTLSQEFFGMLGRIAELQHLNLSVFAAIRSPLAQSIYLYIPSRAFHHTQDDPFEITVSRLLEQVGFPVPPLKSRRKQLLTQNSSSILAQLDGQETLSGRFRFTIAETADRTDWKVLAWIEKRQPKTRRADSNSKLIQAYLKSGRSQESLAKALREIEPLTSYERELVDAANVQLLGNERFFEMARALLGTRRFAELAAEAKGDHLEGRSAKKSPTARLIFRIMQVIAHPVVQRR